MSNPESIFRSSIKSFFKSFFVVLGVFAAFIPIILILSTSPSDRITNKNQIVYLADHTGKKELLPSTSDVILQINIHGVIGDLSLTRASVESQLIESRMGVLKNNRVKAILLHMDTPGGSAIDANGIYTLLQEYKKQYQIPIYAYVEGLCASGGVYITCAADKIYSSPVSIIGSVGVIMGPFFNVKDTLQKWGVVTKTLTRGTDKDAMNPFKEWKENEDASFQPLIDSMYDQFITLVANARPKLSKDILITDIGAKIFNAEKAFELGFTDGNNYSYNRALKELATKAIGEGKNYQVIEFKRKFQFSDFFNGSLRLFSSSVLDEIQILKSSKHGFYYLDPNFSISY